MKALALFVGLFGAGVWIYLFNGLFVLDDTHTLWLAFVSFVVATFFFLPFFGVASMLWKAGS